MGAMPYPSAFPLRLVWILALALMQTYSSASAIRTYSEKQAVSSVHVIARVVVHSDLSAKPALNVKGWDLWAFSASAALLSVDDLQILDEALLLKNMTCCEQ